MKVKELIEKLQTMDQDAKVEVTVWYGIGTYEDYRNFGIMEVYQAQNKIATIHIE